MLISQYSSLHDVKDDWYRLFCQQPMSPFQSFLYTQLFSQQFIRPENLIILKVADNDKTIALAAFERIGTQAMFVGMKPVLGREEITDYGDIVADPACQRDAGKYGHVWQSIREALKRSGIATLTLDYVREDSLTYAFFGKERESQIAPAEVAPWIPLDRSWDAYLESLARVERKELKRKLKRLEAVPYEHVELSTIYKEDFDEFVRLHKLSDSAKETFMSPDMASFFWQVSQLSYSCWKTKLWFVEIEGKRVAAAMGFVSDDRILMYNSGFDPQFSYFSVGLLSHTLIMRKYMGTGYRVYDFMRGAERYKYDLGAVNMQLYRIEINL